MAKISSFEQLPNEFSTVFSTGCLKLSIFSRFEFYAIEYHHFTQSTNDDHEAYAGRRLPIFTIGAY